MAAGHAGSWAVQPGARVGAILAVCIGASAVGLSDDIWAPENLLDLIQAAALGGTLLAFAVRMDHMAADGHAPPDAETSTAPFGRLTVRERGVLQRMMDGKTAAEIAAESFVSVATIRSQIRGVLRKLGVHNQLAAVSLARKTGWTSGL